jgi:integrase
LATRGRPASGQVIEREGKRGRVFAIRFRAYGRRHYLTLNVKTLAEAEEELDRTLSAVKLGVWKPQTEPAAVAQADAEPTFHELASRWVARREHEVDARTADHWRWALSNHLLPFFASLLPSQITVETVEKYKAGKLAERERMLGRIAEWENADTKTRGRKPPAPLGNNSINKTLKVLAQVLDDAVDFGHAETNAARGKKRRLKATRPRRTWLELHEVQALLAAAEKHRALLATMILAGPRVGELAALRWAEVDLAAGRLKVEDSKTDAGVRVVDVTPLLLDELKLHRASAKNDGPQDLVFGTSRGTMRNRSNITRQILQPAIARANEQLAEEGRPPIQGVTNHSLRRTFCALMYEAGATPAYVMGQMGHTDASLALEIYTKVMERKRDTGERMDALIRGANWAQMGTNGAERFDPMPVAATKNPASAGLS